MPQFSILTIKLFRTSVKRTKKPKRMLSSPKYERMLKGLIEGQKILVIGAGASAQELERIPDGATVFTCNRGGLKLFITKQFKRKINLFLCKMNKVDKYGHKEIEEWLPKVKTDIFITDKEKYFKEKQGFKDAYVRFVHYDHLRGIKGAKTDKGSLSAGMKLVNCALHYGAKEVYLIGIDISKAGYFWGEKHGHRHIGVDRKFIQQASKKHGSIYSLSKKSPITRYIRYKKF